MISPWWKRPGGEEHCAGDVQMWGTAARRGAARPGAADSGSGLMKLPLQAYYGAVKPKRRLRRPSVTAGPIFLLSRPKGRGKRKEGGDRSGPSRGVEERRPAESLLRFTHFPERNMFSRAQREGGGPPGVLLEGCRWTSVGATPSAKKFIHT